MFRVDSVEHWHSIGHKLAPKELVWKEICADPGMQLLTIRDPRNGDYPGYVLYSIEPLPSDSSAHPAIRIRVNTHFQPERLTSNRLTEFLATQWQEASTLATTTGKTILSKITE